MSASSQQGNKYGDRFNHLLPADHTQVKAKWVLLPGTDVLRFAGFRALK